MGKQVELYKECISKQLQEVDILLSIYCTTGELQIFDLGVISDFNEFLQRPSNASLVSLLKSNLDYTVKLELPGANGKMNLDVRIELPHLYPTLENAVVTVHTPLLSNKKESYLKSEMEKFINSMDKSETYIFQVLIWIREKFEELLKRNASEIETNDTCVQMDTEFIDFERLWIYSHHIKSKTKRQEIIRQSRILDLSGFIRPGKPGIICVEGLKKCTQEFWRIIKAMHWQKISVCRIESSRIPSGQLDTLRRFTSFKEQLFCDNIENKKGINMRMFLKYLHMHNSSYIKKDLFRMK